MPNGIDLTTVALAVLLVRGVLVLCEPGSGDVLYQSRVRLAAPRWIIVDPWVTLANRLPVVRRILRRFEVDIPLLPSKEPQQQHLTLSRASINRLVDKLGEVSCAPVVPQPGQDLAVAFTGGTTGEPRGVRLGHTALGHSLAHIGHVIQNLYTQQILADSPQQVLYALRFGRSVHVTRGRQYRRARHTLQLIRTGAVDTYFGAPSIWMRMMDLVGNGAAPLPATLRTVLLGGAPVTRDFLKRLQGWLHPTTHVQILYGLTEAGVVCTISSADKLAWNGAGDLVGYPVPGVDLEISAQASEEIGEVVVHSPSLFTGYLGERERGQGNGLMTGDLGRLIEVSGKCALELAGRSKDMVIRRGVNIYPATVEPVLRELRDGLGPLFQDCALVGVWNESRQDEDLVLCIEPRPSPPSPSNNELLNRVAAAAGPDATPDHILVVQAMPVIGRQHKIDRVALRRRAAAAFGLATWPPRQPSPAHSLPPEH
jgi:acyl-CoA synthetase (AMP-forming)/AMP-acid ligase II